MSSHREAPEISKDPVADNTDVYAFVSPDKPDTVTIIANFIPFQNPYGGPNFYEFGDDVLYEIHISNGGTRPQPTSATSSGSRPRSATRRRSCTTPARSPRSPTRPGTARSSTRSPASRAGQARILARDLAAPPVNVGVRSTPNYAQAARGRRSTTIGRNRQVFAGQRADGLLRRPRQHLRPRHAAAVPEAAPDPVRGRGRASTGLQGLNVHTHRAPGPDQRPDPSTARRPTDVLDPNSVIGVWAPARAARSPGSSTTGSAPRLARPLQAGLPAGQPAVQRGHRADGREGPVEQPRAQGRQAVRPVRRQAGTRRTAAGALPGRVPAPGGVQEAAGRPGRDPADRDSEGRRARLPELHRHGPGRHAAAQRRRTAGGEAESARPGRRRRGRLPERAPGLRRRGHRRAPRDRRPHDPAGRPSLQARRRGRGDQGRYDRTRTPTYLNWFPYLGTPAGGYSSKPGMPAVS